MAKTTCHVRPFIISDQPAAQQLILAGLTEHFGCLDPALNSDLNDIRSSFLDLGHIFLVAELNGEMVGTGGLLLSENEGQIVRVSVAGRCRRRGIGRALVRALLARARARGLVRVWMETNDDWEDAIGLYTRCGFREIDRRDGCVFMALELVRNQTERVA